MMQSKVMKAIFNMLAFSAVMAAVANAQAAKIDGGPSASCDGLKVATGKPGKGYSKLFRDVTSVSGNAGLCEVQSTGGLDNLGILSSKKADVGVAQLDQLKFMAQGDANIAKLKVVATLNRNFLHIVVNANGVNIEGEKKLGFFKGDVKNYKFTKLSELKGQSVALVGSAKLLGRQLSKDMGLELKISEFDDDEPAFTALQKNEVMAVLTVAGWPHGKVEALTPAQGLTLASFDGPTNNSLYTVSSISYKKIGIYGVQSLGIQNVLVTRDFAGDKINDVLRLKDMIQKSLPALKDGDFEPAWNEINNLDGNVDWPKLEAKAAAVKIKK